MKSTLAFLFLPFLLAAQISITDSFADGNFTTNPPWTGDTAFFEVNMDHQLQLKDTAAGTRYLSTASGISAEATWEFYARLGFNPSGSNYLKVYLMSDHENLLNPLNGYFVRIGGSSADRISLFRQTGTTETLIAESTDDWVDINPVEVRIRVQRTAAKLWILSADTSAGSNYQLLASGIDSVHSFSTHLGLQPNYTVTRSDKFFFDDIYATGKVFRDTLAPKLLAARAVTARQIEIRFNEPLHPASAENPAMYEVNGGLGLPAAAVLTGSSQQEVALSLSPGLQPNRLYRLRIKGVEDRFGNKLQDSVEIVFYQPAEGDIVINELMVDPNPVVGVPPNALPDREYIELYNTTDVPVSLAGFVLIIGSSSYKLPDYSLAPDSFVVITKDEGAGEFAAHLPVLGIDMSSIALTNGGTDVGLYTMPGKLISTVSYTAAWYQDPNKKDGGWSLEQIDPQNLCGGAANWRASVHPLGGTPGRRNSVAGINPDTTRPRMLWVSIAADSAVMVHFSESLTNSNFAAALFGLDPDPGILQAQLLPPGFSSLLLSFATPVEPASSYRIWLADTLRDCSGNICHFDTLLFAIPQVPQPDDLLINEILFNPLPGGSDFVEIYNRSKKTVDLSKLRIGNWDEDLQQAVNVQELVDESFLIPPASYVALTQDAAFLYHEYILKKPGNVVVVKRLPSFPDAEGSVALLTSGLELIDHFSYSEKMHLQVLKDPEGVSLERISFDKPTNDKDNWHSAAATAGFATPGYQNSQYFRMKPAAEFSLEPKLFSPNQDGYNDLLKIVYSFQRANNLVSISIHSSNGYPVRQLQNRTSVGAEGFFTWDGTDDNGQLMNSGIYIVVFDYFNENGTREVLRKTCVLSL